MVMVVKDKGLHTNELPIPPFCDEARRVVCVEGARANALAATPTHRLFKSSGVEIPLDGSGGKIKFVFVALDAIVCFSIDALRFFCIRVIFD